MRKIFAIALLVCFLVADTEAYQLLRLPVIFQHYQEHHRADCKLSFVAFLNMHYLHGSPRDADYDRDMQLPFKIIHHPLSPALIGVPPSAIDLPRPLRQHFAQVFKGLITGKLPEQLIAEIYQPPRPA